MNSQTSSNPQFVASDAGIPIPLHAFRPEQQMQHTMPDVNGKTGVFVGPAGRRHTAYMGGEVTLLLDSAQTGGRFGAGVASFAPDGGPPAHVHRTFDEVFYVLDGEFLFRAGEEDYIAYPGDMVFIPREMAHQFRNIGGVEGRLLTYWTPAGFEEWFFRIGALEAAGQLNWETMMQTARDLDTQALPELLQLADLTETAIKELRQKRAGEISLRASNGEAKIVGIR